MYVPLWPYITNVVHLLWVNWRSVWFSKNILQIHAVLDLHGALKCGFLKESFIINAPHKSLITGCLLTCLFFHSLKKRIPYVCHYNPRLAYSLPHFWRPFLCFQWGFFQKMLSLCMVSTQEQFAIKKTKKQLIFITVGNFFYKHQKIFMRKRNIFKFFSLGQTSQEKPYFYYRDGFVVKTFENRIISGNLVKFLNHFIFGHIFVILIIVCQQQNSTQGLFRRICICLILCVRVPTFAHFGIKS